MGGNKVYCCIKYKITIVEEVEVVGALVFLWNVLCNAELIGHGLVEKHGGFLDSLRTGMYCHCVCVSVCHSVLIALFYN